MSARSEPTVQKTEWTQSLIEDLCTALQRGRDDATVRGFARELMDDKDFPLSYLVRKVGERLGEAEGRRLEVIVKGRQVVERERERDGLVERLKRFVRGLLR